jgi:hypothetical protein
MSVTYIRYIHTMTSPTDMSSVKVLHAPSYPNLTATEALLVHLSSL